MRHGEPWYSVWFDSPYYGVLYGNRDQMEADIFIGRLVRKLHTQPPAFALDVACGTGRHAVVLADLGYKVTGIDLSVPSIRIAKQHSGKDLRFQVLDMRAIEWQEKFDIVVNLFTSFGYFSDESQERQVLARIERALRPGGELVIDFLNAARTVAELVSAERTEREGILFDITREIRDGTIVKTIVVDDPSQDSSVRSPRFQERVRLLTSDVLCGYLQDLGLIVESRYGDYFLNEFRPETSDRLILVARKPEH